MRSLNQRSGRRVLITCPGADLAGNMAAAPDLLPRIGIVAAWVGNVRVERPTSDFERSRSHNESSWLEGNFGSHLSVLAVFPVRDAAEGLGLSRPQVSEVALHVAENFTG